MMGARKTPTPETFIRQLPYSVIKYFSMLVDVDRNWQVFVSMIPKKLEHVWTDDYEKRYSSTQIRLFEQTSYRPDGSPTKSILDDWGTQNARVKHLIRVLQLCHFYQMADYLAVDVLHGEPVTRLPNETESLQAGDLPVPQWDAPPKQPKQNKLDSQGSYVNSSSSSVNFISAASTIDKVQMKDISMPTEVDSSAKGSDYSCLYKSSGEDVSYDHLSPGQNKDVLYNRVSSFESGGENSLLLTAAQTNREPQENCELQTLQVRKFDTNDEALKSDPAGEKSPANLFDNLTLGTQDSVEDIMLKIGSCEMPYVRIKQITDNFNDLPYSKGGRIIGVGGFGEVFLGLFPNGCKVAVKRLKTDKEECDKQFVTELEALTKHRHRNIVNLYGFSVDGPSKCLVYEYLCNGSLEDRLMRKDDTPPLSVATRISILQGTAQGIDFLNTNGIVHRDIKSANVLLSESFEAKVGDFATARRGPQGNFTKPVSTQVVIGTTAYLAPEAHTYDISTKLDSYSFGIVIYEALTALPPLDMDREEKDLKSHIESYDIEDFLDNSGGEWPKEAVEMLVKIAENCTEKKKLRANVSDILADLLSIVVKPD